MTVDVIILSNASSTKLINLTLYAIRTLNKSEVNHSFNITIIESSNYEWKELKDVKVINVLTQFNYNKHMNIGVRNGTSDWVVCCNNDLEFKPGWFSELLKHSYDAMSPKSAVTIAQARLKTTEGYRIGREVSGWCWCLVMKRKVWNTIGGFDERFPGWCSDDSFVMQLIENEIKHYFVAESIVNHLNGAFNTMKTFESEEIKRLTTDSTILFNKTYKRNIMNLNPEYAENEKRFK